MVNILKYVFSKSYRKHRWLKKHLSKLRPLYKAMRPLLNVLKSVKLPPRYPMGDKRNIKRVFEVAKALQEARPKDD